MSGVEFEPTSVLQTTMRLRELSREVDLTGNAIGGGLPSLPPAIASVIPSRIAAAQAQLRARSNELGVEAQRLTARIAWFEAIGSDAPLADALFFGPPGLSPEAPDKPWYEDAAGWTKGAGNEVIDFVVRDDYNTLTDSDKKWWQRTAAGGFLALNVVPGLGTAVGKGVKLGVKGVVKGGKALRKGDKVKDAAKAAEHAPKPKPSPRPSAATAADDVATAAPKPARVGAADDVATPHGAPSGGTGRPSGGAGPSGSGHPAGSGTPSGGRGPSGVPTRPGPELRPNSPIAEFIVANYRKGATVGDGSTAAAATHELRTGGLIKGKGHLLKAAQMWRRTDNILYGKTPDLRALRARMTTRERQIITRERERLEAVMRQIYARHEELLAKSRRTVLSDTERRLLERTERALEEYTLQGPARGPHA